MNTTKNIELLKNNKCYFSKFVIDEYIKKTTNNKLPKNINILTSRGDKYFAKIRDYIIIHEDDYFSVKDEQNFSVKDEQNFLFKEDLFYDNTVRLSFKLQNKKLLMKISDFIESRDDKNFLFYKFSQNTVLHKNEKFVANYSMDDALLISCSDSPLDDKLMPPYKYYNLLLDELEAVNDKKSIYVDIKLFRDYYNLIKDLSADKNIIILPVIDSIDRLNSVSVIVNEEKKYDFYEGRFYSASKEDNKLYLETFKENGIKLPDDKKFGVLDLSALDDKSIQLFHRIFNDYNNESVKISRNIEGEKIRIKRVIKSIERILKDKVANKKLVECICNNNIDNAVDDFSEYEPNKEYIKELKKKYPILKNNREQLMAIDKVCQMHKNKVDILLIQGPPGTGKTELILSLMKELSKMNENILITSNVHVACDNIVDRFKNNKDLILKRYTATSGEQYENEIIENTKKYIENQVLENFKYKNNIIDSEKKYLNLANKKVELNKQKEKIIDYRKKYTESINDYKKLLEKAENLKKQQREIGNTINVCEQELSELNNQCKCHSEELLNNESKILEFEKDHLKYAKEISILEEEKIQIENEINYSNDWLECCEKTIKDNKENIKNLNIKIKECNCLIEKSNLKLNYLDNFNIKNAEQEILDYFNKKNSTINKYCNEIMGNSLNIIEGIRNICDKLEKDYEFIDAKNISLSTIEYLHFNEKIKSVLKEFNPKYSGLLNLVEDLDDFKKISPFKSLIMSIFPFIKYRNKGYSDYMTKMDKTIRMLKEIQINCSKYVSEIFRQQIELNFENHKLNEKCKLEEKLNELSIIKTEIQEYKNVINDIKEAKEIEKRKRSQNVEKMLRNQEEINKCKEKFKRLELLINLIKVAKYKLVDKKNKNLIESKEIEQIYDLKKEELKTIDSSIKTNEEEISRLYKEKKEIIDKSDNILKKADIDIKNINSEVQLIEVFINRVEENVQELEKCSFLREDAFNLLFNYAKELEKIIKSNDEKFKFYQKGKGTLFKEMFLLDKNKKGSLISMTTNQVSKFLQSSEKDDMEFGFAIIDEASKCCFEDIIVSLPYIKKLILIGDFMQLDPKYDEYSKIDLKYQNLLTSDDWNRINKSSFSMLLSQFIKENESKNINNFDSNPFVAVMKRQYRMNKGIYELIEPIYAMHKGFELIDEKNTTSNDLKCIEIKGEEIQQLGGTSFYNEEEVDEIVAFLKEFKKNRKLFPSIKTIGIITGYKAQENRIRRKLSSSGIEGMAIGTFDRFQGTEYDLVIVSLVRTKKFGFTSNIRRMNVACSRAKKHLIIFGNFEALNQIATSGANNDDFMTEDASEKKFVTKNLIPKLYKICKMDDFKCNVVGTKERIALIMDFLKENSYETDENYGNYVID